MNDKEKEAARLGMETLNEALIDLGDPPLGDNPHVRMIDPVVLDFSNAVVEKPGCAPLLFRFGPYLDLSVGPFSEVLNEEVTEATKDDVRYWITQVLRSEVTFRERWRSVEIVLGVPGSEPWRRLRVFGAGKHPELEQSYAPYAR